MRKFCETDSICISILLSHLIIEITDIEIVQYEKKYEIYFSS